MILFESMSGFSALFFALVANAIVLGAALKNSRMMSTAIFIFAFSVFGFMVGGDGAIASFGSIAVAIAFAAVAAFVFKWLLIWVSPKGLKRELRTAPLTASFGMLVIVIVLVLMIFAPYIAPFGETESVGGTFEVPNEQFLMGTDRPGRDVWSRIVYGARNSVGIALLATGIAFFIGAMGGLFAAIRGGWMDQFLGRVSDIIMSMPSLIFALLMLSIFGTDTWVVIVVVAAVYAPRVFRLTRAVAGNIVVMDYVEAARLRGESSWYLMRREILPNAKSPLIAEFGLEFCFVFLLISGLSFLGIGLQPPAAHWGSMVKDLASQIRTKPQPFYAAGAIALLTVSVNFVVDWMLHRSSGLKD